MPATNADLDQAVASGAFREDLLYRLRVVPVRVPALAERREDVAELARFFLRRACDRHGLPQLELSSAALRAMEAVEWPGNVRQLSHAVEAGAIRAAGMADPCVERRYLFPDADAEGDADEVDLTFQQATRRFHRELVRSTLEETGWNAAEAARRLDLARSHLYTVIKSFELERK